MRRVLTVVEGPTERAVIERTIARYLGARNLSLHAKVVGKTGHKGGVRNFQSVRKEILALLKHEPASYVSTFFDFYGLPENWPGVREAKGKKTHEMVAIIGSAMSAAVASGPDALHDQRRFLPYVQMHELEALLFSDPQVMADVFERPELEPQFTRIARECGGCEEIDDNAETAPSKRIERLFANYRKGSGSRSHAPLIVDRIGVDAVRRACPNFNQWISKLERIGAEGLPPT